MTREELLDLRERFRIRFTEHDFCIGQEQVEKFFRELLGEPEPELPTYNGPYSSLSATDISEIYETCISSLEHIFDRDDKFYDKLMKRYTFYKLLKKN